jgi:EAL domain-containing protein (putative c-di-GMP-specific phosphodiesterase class I)
VSPEEFIPVAEESSIVSVVDCWVLQEACRRGAQWCKAGGTLAVNLSARTLRQNDVVRALSQSLRRTAIPPGRLILEITETTLLDGLGATSQTLARLRELGVKLSIDDFGTGHSSLSQLQQTDVDILKIDQSFVSQMDHSVSSAAIVSAIITVGHALGLTLVAEGVERPEQAAMLREQGCDGAQGWLFGQPLPADDIDQEFGLTFPDVPTR